MDKRLTNSIINRIFYAGSTVLKCTKKAGRHGRAMPGIDRMKENKYRIFYCTKDKLRGLIKASIEIFAKNNLADAMLFSALTGVRQGELMKLKPCDIDLEKNLVGVGGMPHLIPKGNETRSIPIAKEIQLIIRDRMDYTRLFGEDWMNKDQLYRTFKKVRNYCGIPETHVWHSFRDTFGTMICEVHHPKQAQDLLGHKSIEQTLKYCHPSEDANRAAVNSLSIGVAL